jgi:ribosomal protein S18 acetylase RimI-like enzyme
MIRRGHDDDWPSVRALWREIDEHHAALAPDYFRCTARGREEWRRLLGDSDGAVFVATRADAGTTPETVVGAVSVRIYDTPPDPAMVPRRRAHVETLVVAAGQRRRGIGRELMAEAADWARRRAAAELVLTVWAGNTAAEQFYQRLGYQLLSRVLRAPLI